MHPMLLLDNTDIERAVTLEGCLSALEQMYRAVAAGDAVEGTRSQTHVPLDEPGIGYCLKTMDGAIAGSGYMVMRLTSDIIDSNAVDGIPRREKLPRGPGNTYCGLITVFRTADLAPVAMLHDGYLQLIRVACTGALSARVLSNRAAGDLAVIGAGAQAWWHVRALQQVRRLRRVRVYSPTAANRAAFAQRVRQELGLPAEAADSAESAVRDADLVVAATNASTPVLQGDWLSPGAHVVSIVSGDRKNVRREIDDTVVRRAARVVAHWKPNAMHHGTGDLAGPVNAGILGWDDIDNLCDVIAGRAAGRATAADITLFKNNGGMGLQFAALAPAVYEQARAQNIGKALPGEWFLQHMKP